MKKEEVAIKLNSISNNSQYIRVSNSHPLELYLGKNESGYFTLRYNGNFMPIKIVGNNLLSIKQVKTSSYNSLLFSFNSSENISLFYSFCEDIITKTEKFEGSDGYIEIVNRYNQWKKMFYGLSTLLNEQEIMGLIGELLFLKNFAFENYGITTGLNGWSGPEPTHKDFSYGDRWYEIKAINNSKNSVPISSLEQLDGDLEGKLYVYFLEKMSPTFEGVTLNNLVLEISDMLKLDSDKDIFVSKLKQCGYSYNETYDNYVYNLITHYIYLVNDNFPRIKKSTLSNAISKVQYDLLLSLIERYREE